MIRVISARVWVGFSVRVKVRVSGGFSQIKHS